MQRVLAAAVLGGLALTVQAASPQSPASNPGSQQLVQPNPAAPPEDPSGYLPTLPAAPKGRSTILGGQIRDVDPVRDQFSLHIYGQRPMKILYDERTQVYRDGVKIPLHDLGTENRASVETVLDGDKVFALTIHILSQAAEGECEGRVLGFNPSTGVLTISSDISPQPVRLLVPASASIARVGEPDFTATRSGVSDFAPGTLVRATFASDASGHDAARQITVLAVPGAGFVFSGNISFLDVHNGFFIVVDPRDQRSYQIHFDSARLPQTASLRTGTNVTVNAVYDGSRYQASTISINQ
jgi:hypothetical protein